MKIIFRSPAGRQSFNPNQIVSLGNAIAKSIYDAIGDRTMGLSQTRLNKLVRAIEAEATKEAFGIFDKAVNIILRSKSRTAKRMFSPYTQHTELTAFKAADLGGGRAILVGEQGIPTGNVNWLDLSRAWVSKKRNTRPGTEQKFFVHKGNLVRSLGNKGYNDSWISRMGGITAKAEGIEDFKKRRLTRGDAKFALARLEVDIFPSIPASMLPMMSSQRWNTDNDGAFERRIIGGMTGQKLAGPDGRHRPLVQPLVQFWMAYRIPRAVQRAITRTLKVRNV